MRVQLVKGSQSKLTHIFLSQFSLERLIKNDRSDLSNVVQIYNAMGDDKKKETKIEKKD